jgi:hypothetical protein
VQCLVAELSRTECHCTTANISSMLGMTPGGCLRGCPFHFPMLILTLAPLCSGGCLQVVDSPEEARTAGGGCGDSSNSEAESRA